MKAERFTSLDRGILKDAKENVLVVSAMLDGERGRSERRAEGAQLSMRVGRLRRLEQMGLAEEKRTGVWAIDPQLETKLRSLGERGDIMVTMNRVMRAHGIDRPAGDFAIFSGARKSAAGHRPRRRGRHRRRDDRPQVSRRRRHRRPHPLCRDGQARGPRHPRAGDDRRAVGRWRQRPRCATPRSRSCPTGRSSGLPPPRPRPGSTRPSSPRRSQSSTRRGSARTSRKPSSRARSG